MKHRLLALVALVLAAVPVAWAQTNPSIGTVTNGLTSFSNGVTKSLPLAASSGIDWSNAYIGQLIDSNFPFVHLGVGVASGVTSIPVSTINPLLEAFGQPDVPYAGIPFTVVNARLGGLFLPFDIGFKVGFLPDALASAVKGFTFKYQNFGVDLRYNLVKSDFWLPDVSVGGGVNYLSASATYALGADEVIHDTSGDTLTIPAPVANLSMTSLEFEGKAQVSKTLFFLLTPYLGLDLGYGSSTATAGINSGGAITSSGGYGIWQPYLGQVTSQGFNLSNSAGNFLLKVYGGTSINVLIVKVDLQGVYSILDGSYGGSVGVRIQL
jgi:hypothetical protein